MISSGTHSKNLILITNHYPFGSGESFIEHEMPFLSQAFENILVISRNVTSNISRSIPDKVQVERVNPVSNWKEYLLVCYLVVLRLSTLILYLTQEKKYCSVHKKAPYYPKLFQTLLKGLLLSWRIRTFIKKYNFSGETVLYSYWMDTAAVALTLIHSRKVKLKRVSRAHGGDLYEARHSPPYLPFHEIIVNRLDKVVCISENGAQYLKNKISPASHTKITVSRLGSPAIAAGQSAKQHNLFLIVSCAFLHEHKRVNLIIDALSGINDLNIHWIHLGGGPLLDSLKEEASKRLAGSSVTFDLRGNLSNQDILDFYKKNYVDLFISLSSTEGIPVTFMEAQSCGIPILTTEVGGVSEIVNNTNGSLLAADPAANIVADEIRRILLLPDEQVNQLRRSAFSNWNLNYNAETNFSNFVRQLKKL